MNSNSRDAAGGSFNSPSLSTDDLGRDRWARLFYGMRVSLVLAPLAALFTTVLAGVIGGIAGYFGGWTERGCKLLIDLFLCPCRGCCSDHCTRRLTAECLPPEASVTVTFALLGLLGWAASARVICAEAKDLMKSKLLWMAVLPAFGV